MKTNNATTKPVEIRNYKKENIDIKRAEQENNYIYGLILKLKGGDIDAGEKLLKHSLLKFNPDVEFAAKLMEEAGEMLTDALNTYTDGHGNLSDVTLGLVEEAVLNEDHGDMSDAEKAQEYKNKVNSLEIGCSTVKT